VSNFSIFLITGHFTYTLIVYIVDYIFFLEILKL
jgi:hypothetical protein